MSSGTWEASRFHMKALHDHALETQRVVIGLSMFDPVTSLEMKDCTTCQWEDNPCGQLGCLTTLRAYTASVQPTRRRRRRR